MPAKEIAIAAIIATSQVSDPVSPKEKILMGGETALYATQQCIQDGRDIYAGFILETNYGEGYIKVNCQILKTTTGDYFASKGVYYLTSKMKDTMI